MSGTQGASKPWVEILFDDAGILVQRADGPEAYRLALHHLDDAGYAAIDAIAYMNRLEPISRHWRKVPASGWMADEGYGWILHESKPGPGAFWGTWFRRKI